jgi:hypothetical protein
VVAFFVLFTAECCYGLARSPKLWDRPVRGVLVVLFLVLWLAAVVVWRQRWAWVLMLLTVLSGVLEPLWGDWHGALVYGVNVVSVGLLLAPAMRSYVGVERRRPAHDVPRR